MFAKKNIRNICVSFLFIILFDTIYSVLGLLVINNINIRIVPAVIVIALFCSLLCTGYMIGQKLLSAVKIRIVSIVIIPMILLLLIFGFGIIVIPVASLIMQYPVIILSESLGIGMQLADIPSLFHIIVILHHMICCLPLLIGSYHKKHTQ